MQHIIITTLLTFLLFSHEPIVNDQNTFERKERTVNFTSLSNKQLKVSSNSNATSKKNDEKKSPNLDDFLGCWLWGDTDDLNDAFAILEVKPNGKLIVHRTDLGKYGEVDENATYKISGKKIKFITHLLMQSNYHIENKKNQIFLVEEYPKTPNKFKKINCR